MSETGEMAEFSQTVDLKSVPARGQTVDLEPTESQRAIIAERLELISLPAFASRLELSWERGGDTLRLEGAFTASVQQRCVATLKPVTSEIDYRFVERYAIGADDVEQEIIVSADDEADLDVIPEEGLDLADVAVQHLSLALDPYPRHQSAEELDAVDDEEGERPAGPFAKLAVLKGGKS